jgi:hypothetical protein
MIKHYIKNQRCQQFKYRENMMINHFPAGLSNHQVNTIMCTSGGADNISSSMDKTYAISNFKNLPTRSIVVCVIQCLNF